MRTAGSILLLIILVPASVVVFFVYSMTTNVLTAAFFKDELVRQRVYDLAREQLAIQIGKINLVGMPVTAEELQHLAQRALPAAWLQQNVESTLDRAFAWLNGPEGTALALPINFAAPKAELAAGVDALLISTFPRLPVCAAGNPGTLCRVQGMTVDALKDMLRQQGIDLHAIIGQLPDSFDLANPVLPAIALGDQHQQTAESGELTVEKDEQAQDRLPAGQEQTTEQSIQNVVKNLEQAKAQYHIGVRIWRSALVAYAVLILGFLVLNVRGWRRFLRWAGILAVTVSVLPLAMSIASKPILERAILPNLVLTQMPPEVQAAIPVALRDVQHALFFPILIFSACLVALGVGAVIGAQFLPRQPSKA